MGESRLDGCTSSTSPGSTTYGPLTCLPSWRGMAGGAGAEARIALASVVSRLPWGNSDSRPPEGDAVQPRAAHTSTPPSSESIRALMGRTSVGDKRWLYPCIDREDFGVE